MSKGNRANKMSEKISNINLEFNEITKFRLDKTTKIKEYLNNGIKERKGIVNKINKYIVAFDYADKVFITLSASFGTLSIASHATVVGIPVGIAGASLTLFNFFFNFNIINTIAITIIFTIIINNFKIINIS